MSKIRGQAPPSFNEFAFRVSDWFHTWMDDAYASDEPLWDENLLRELHIEAAREPLPST